MKYFNPPDGEYLAALSAALDYEKHNALVRELEAKTAAGKPDRMRMHAGFNSRFLLLDKRYNKAGVTYKEFTCDSRLMFEVLAEFGYFCNMYAPYFHIMGSGSPLSVYPDFQNFAEAQWMGAELVFPENDVPYTRPFITEDNKNILFDRGIPEPFSGIYATGWEHYEKFKEYAKDYEIDGCRVTDVWPTGLTSDGPFTLACELLGTTEVCVLIYEEPEYIGRLLDFLAAAIIARVKAFRKAWGVPQKLDGWFMADDSIALLSTDMYEQLVLPRHKRMVDELLTENGALDIHLCGDATRHYPVIQKQLRCRSFDTGFPVKHGELCKTLGPETTIMGGPSVAFLQSHNEAEIEAEVRRIIEEVKPYTRRFVMREGNNVPPGMDLRKILAMYRATVKYGKYEEV